MRAGDGAAFVNSYLRRAQGTTITRRFRNRRSLLPKVLFYRRSDSDKSCRFASSQSEFASPDSANLRLRSEIK